MPITMLTTILLMTLSLKLKSSWEMVIIMLTMLGMMSMTFMQPVSCMLTNNMMIDLVSMMMIILTLWITTLMFLSSYKNKNFFFSMNLLLLLVILLICFSVNNIIMFYISFESSMIPTILLIILWGPQSERMKASFYIMLYTISASLPLLMLIIYLTEASFHTTMMLSYIYPLPNMKQISWLMVMVAFLVKLPMFSLHLWLPKAHVEAPVSGSMILAGVLLKLGGYGMIRMNTILNQKMFSMSYVIMSLSIVGAIITNMMCMRQTDLKSLIAYSSIGHMSLLIISTMSNSKLGQYGSLIIMLTHGLSSSCLFFMSNNIYEELSTRNILLMSFSAITSPSKSFLWMLVILTNMALPPSLNILSEIFIMMSSFFIMNYLILMLMVTSFSTSVYSLYIYSMINHGNQLKLINYNKQMSSISITTIFMHLWPLFILTPMSTNMYLWC